MRCKNCGWENDPNRLNCEKCNAPLSSSMGDADSMNQPSGINLKGTIPEGEIFAGGQDPSANQEHSAPHKCVKCGYPIGRGMNVCPQCGTPVQSSSVNHPQRQGTVNPWAAPEKGTFCTLKPIAWENEQTEHNAITFSGNNIVLNRANTDPNNQTITSQEQAELVCEEGEWFICDKSSQKTTYVHAGRKTKLEKGDIIILGNRQFVFNC